MESYLWLTLYDRASTGVQHQEQLKRVVADYKWVLQIEINQQENSHFKDQDSNESIISGTLHKLQWCTDNIVQYLEKELLITSTFAVKEIFELHIHFSKIELQYLHFLSKMVARLNSFDATLNLCASMLRMALQLKSLQEFVKATELRALTDRSFVDNFFTFREFIMHFANDLLKSVDSQKYRETLLFAALHLYRTATERLDGAQNLQKQQNTLETTYTKYQETILKLIAQNRFSKKELYQMSTEVKAQSVEKDHQPSLNVEWEYFEGQFQDSIFLHAIKNENNDRDFRNSKQSNVHQVTSTQRQWQSMIPQNIQEQLKQYFAISKASRSSPRSPSKKSSSPRLKRNSVHQQTQSPEKRQKWHRPKPVQTKFPNQSTQRIVNLKSEATSASKQTRPQPQIFTYQEYEEDKHHQIIY